MGQLYLYQQISGVFQKVVFSGIHVLPIISLQNKLLSLRPDFLKKTSGDIHMLSGNTAVEVVINGIIE